MKNILRANHTSNSRGFTLIELLVVIAIIGILSSIVLAALNTARSRGNSAKVKAQIQEIRAAAELYYTANTSYSSDSGTCAAGMFIDTASGMARLTQSASYPVGVTIACASNPAGDKYMVTATLPAPESSGGTSYTMFCIDSRGQAKLSNTVASSGTVEAGCQ